MSTRHVHIANHLHCLCSRWVMGSCPVNTHKLKKNYCLNTLLIKDLPTERRHNINNNGSVFLKIINERNYKKSILDITSVMDLTWWEFNKSLSCHAVLSFGIHICNSRCYTLSVWKELLFLQIVSPLLHFHMDHLPP